MGLLRDLLSRARSGLERRVLGLSVAEIRYTVDDVRAEIRATRSELLAEIQKLRNEVEALTGTRGAEDEGSSV